jgi:GxxExxY protein
MDVKLVHAELTEQIIGAAIEVHRAIGPGLLESIYEAALSYELHQRGLGFERQAQLPVVYKGVALGHALAADLVVESRVIVEIKAVELVARVHHAQLLTYMRLAGVRVGLLVNFNAPTIRDGLHRRVL